MCLCLLFTACKSGSKQYSGSHEDSHQESEEGHQHEGEIHFSQEQAQACDLKTEIVRKEVFNAAIPAFGELQSLPGKEWSVVATSSGIISFSGNSILTEGQAVKKGAVLFSISAEGMPEGDPSRKAQLEYESARKEYERAEKLIADKIISEQEFENVRLRYELAKSAYSAASSNTLKAGVDILSPSDGYIVQLYVKQGEYVTVGQPLLRIAKNDRLALKAEVSQRYYGELPSILDAHIKLISEDSYHSLKDLNASLISIGGASYRTNPYISVYFEFENSLNYPSGAYVELYLLCPSDERVINIPLSSLIEDQGKYYVFIREHEDMYRKQKVTLGRRDGFRTEILSGLKEGEEVVVNGAYSLRAASATAVIPGHSHNH
ncbi:MAG: efflux RND transporter periplasmic adaptor subunit [Candidatus Cryptobacteroides sp.]